MIELKKRAEDDTAAVEAADEVRKKMGRDMEAVQARVDQLQADNEKLLRSKKKLESEVCHSNTSRAHLSEHRYLVRSWTKQLILFEIYCFRLVI